MGCQPTPMNHYMLIKHSTVMCGQPGVKVGWEPTPIWYQDSLNKGKIFYFLNFMYHPGNVRKMLQNEHCFPSQAATVGTPQGQSMLSARSHLLLPVSKFTNATRRISLTLRVCLQPEDKGKMRFALKQ